METETTERMHTLTDKKMIRVLLVEDDAVDSRLVKQTLTGCSRPIGFAVDLAESLSAAIERLGANNYEVILVDRMLPDSSGIETVHRVHAANPQIPIVMLTGLNDEEIELSAIQSGVTGFLVKGQSLGTLAVPTVVCALELNKGNTFRLETIRRLRDISQQLLAVRKKREKEQKLALETNQRLQQTSQKEHEDKTDAALQQAHAGLEVCVEELSIASALLKGEVTRREHAEHGLLVSEENLRKVILTNPGGILIVDRDGIMQFVNPAAESLFGRDAGELVGKPFYVPAITTGTAELDIMHPNGELRVVEMRAVETEWNGHIADMVLCVDITDRKKAEMTLTEANKTLVECNQLKDEFIAAASHEFRTPLSIMAGAIRLLQDGVSANTIEQQRTLLSMTMQSIQRLGRIVDSLLNLSKMESGAPDLHAVVVNICGLIQDVVSNHELLAREKGIRLDCDVPQECINVRLDPDKMKEVLGNLLSNSLRFTPKDGWIKILCGKQNGVLHISVQDSGIGIARDDISRIFDKFTQVNREAGPGYHGTGLGLAIVKGLVDMQGGTIEVESEVGRGTTFTISFNDPHEGLL